MENVPIGPSGTTAYLQWAVENPPGASSSVALTRALAVVVP
jgi:hypothetical protein